MGWKIVTGKIPKNPSLLYSKQMDCRGNTIMTKNVIHLLCCLLILAQGGTVSAGGFITDEVQKILEWFLIKMFGSVVP